MLADWSETGGTYKNEIVPVRKANLKIADCVRLGFVTATPGPFVNPYMGLTNWNGLRLVNY